MVGDEEEIGRARELSLMEHQVESVSLRVTGEDEALRLVVDDEGAGALITCLFESAVELQAKRAVAEMERACAYIKVGAVRLVTKRERAQPELWRIAGCDAREVAGVIGVQMRADEGERWIAPAA